MGWVRDGEVRVEQAERLRGYLFAPEPHPYYKSQRNEQVSEMQVLLLPEDEELSTPPGHLPLLLPQTSSSQFCLLRGF